MRYTQVSALMALAISFSSAAEAKTTLTQSEYEAVLMCIGTWEGAMNAIPVIYSEYPDQAALDAALANGAQLKRINEAIFMATSKLGDTLDLGAGAKAYTAGLMVVGSKKDNRPAYVEAIETNLVMAPACVDSIRLAGQKLAD